MFKKFKLVAINLVLFFVLIEAGLFLYYSFQKRHPVTAHSLFSENFKFDALSSNDCPWGHSVGLHPYLEVYYPVLERCQLLERNNYGLHGIDIPFEKNEAYYTILVVGASVAEQIGGHLDYSTQLAVLDEALNKNWISPSQKPFRVVNASKAGSHQPETLIQTALFLDIADQVISVESYNESGYVSGGRLIEHPGAAWGELATGSQFPIRKSALEFLTTAARHTLKSPLRFSYSLFSILHFSISRLDEDYQQKVNARTPFPPLPDNWSAEKKKEFFLKQYKSYVEKLNGLVRSQNKKYTLFIQPAPYK